MIEKKDNIQNTFLYKVANSLLGSRRDFTLITLISMVLGILYSFHIWEQPAILVIFGIVLPFFYTVILYYFIRKAKLPVDNSSKVLKFSSGKFGNIVFMFIDLIIVTGAGLLIFFGIIDYILVRLFALVVIPFLQLTSLRFGLKSKELLNSSFDEDEHKNETG